MENVNDYAELQQRLFRAEAEVRRLSVVDELTGLHNRRGFLMLADQELKVLRRSRRQALVLFIAVDGLNGLNDSAGRDAGDQLLVDVAKLLHSSFRDEDVVARIGGDEFAVFIPDARDPRAIAARLQDENRDLHLSIGASKYDPAAPRALDELLAEADAAMYDDKRTRRSQT